jgi:hypothetical protein
MAIHHWQKQISGSMLANPQITVSQLKEVAESLKT